MRTKTHSSIFADWEVRAALEDRKTQFRRAIKLPESIDEEHRGACWEPATKPDWYKGSGATFIDQAHPIESYPWIVEPPYAVGERIYVKERILAIDAELYYEADESGVVYELANEEDYERIYDRLGCSAHHMPRWASRLTTEITAVLVERVRDMHHKADEFRAEGVVLPPSELFAGINTSDKLERVFVKHWDRRNAKRGFGWDKNPWVWAYTFKRVREVAK